MYLGIDLGRKTTGVAISAGQLASPYATITHKNIDQAVNSIVQTIELEGIATVVIGCVEGKIKTLFEGFAKKLHKQKPDLKIILWDETLTTGQATQTMIKLQVPKMRRRQKEHEVAAAIILQSYLDSQ
ncbi:hypothetical protein A2697_04645 [Candidatus Curtissbacteria bacterium RIFCSPHIGHO2_01_FULL_41_44]|uniref:YqgF/RNase H-like domain-containing protein n=1 Tax=Candidatus Curtissbacteria bacterium RIFCSPLOWO2_01_FULL_42_50 TaxID=1797730 RepID=A0A1F5H2Q7_9BACT|nr:MAG: hypothetical protein A3C33_01755 [Candidatus Curtissbacteria bacterium RIFCSPHIGHO2_02_FULL_42_58]OGD94781.1 MAG: hypothetical protein A2697_04645 [Candidatus Curtissbacteria bacterium RIFCSPHIGHO2_01_FULL_41_44]OGD96325.1 MAG: hypothetical protein A3E71_02110 [Candidatus Curtissbacteria bacterium RIFCSPHIGHO2_12_FULL_42_33]OGD98344.1 MAG: hypothetical protein A3B54_00625 [Candidatus Curtissbacteria bacterium RIFCSPLOWO2_01_FULL_42_50]OGE02981.1 MAG: hypothetical protein A3G16_04615 [Ca